MPSGWEPPQLILLAINLGCHDNEKPLIPSFNFQPALLLLQKWLAGKTHFFFCPDSVLFAARVWGVSWCRRYPSPLVHSNTLRTTDRSPAEGLAPHCAVKFYGVFKMPGEDPFLELTAKASNYEIICYTLHYYTLLYALCYSLLRNKLK